jgi:hypothetical protein
MRCPKRHSQLPIISSTSAPVGDPFISSATRIHIAHIRIDAAYFSASGIPPHVLE